jgi:multiple sugar transport system permease protein
MAAGQSRRRDRLIGYLLLSPAFLLVGSLLLYPLIYVFWLSLTDRVAVPGLGPFVGLRHYRALWNDPVFWQAAGTTAGLVVLTALAQLIVGVLTALLLWWRFWGRSLVFLSVFVPWAFPATFSAFAWYWLLIPPFPTFYTLPLQDARWWLEGMLGAGAWPVGIIATMSIWRASSIIAVFLLAGFTALPDELLDVGRLEARHGWRYFWRVVAPLSRRLLALAAIVALVIAYIEYASMYVETGGRITVPVLGTMAYREAIQSGNAPLGAALSLVQIPIAITLMLGCLYVVEGRADRSGIGSSRARAPAEPPPEAPPPKPAQRLASPVAPRRRLRRNALLAGGVVAALLVMVFHLLPVYYTAVQAFRSLPEYAFGNPFWVYQPSFEDLQEAVGNPVLWQWGWNTLVIYGGALLTGLALSLVAGYALARFDLPGARWLARAMFCTYFVPQMAVIIPVFQVFHALALDDSLTGMVLLYFTLTVPFSTWLFYAYFQGLPVEVEEHARLEGGRAQVFFRIVLPLSWPVVMAAGLFAVGMMASDVLYASTFSLTDATKTLPAGLGLNAVELDEWAFANAAILLSSLPIIALCAVLSPYYVRGLRAALIEGS